MNEPTINIKQINFDLNRFQQSTSRARNGKEALIEEIVAKCQCRTKAEQKNLAKRIAIWANTTGATETDLHAMLQKHRDPNVRNYGGLVNYLIKIRRATDN